MSLVGATLSHYRITEELGRGGMGIVYLAEDAKLDRHVAIKVLPASALSSAEDRARFYREAKAAAALNHPNIAQVYQIDEAVPDEDESGEPLPFIAMEFVDGDTLAKRIKDGPIDLKEAVRVASRIAEVLTIAHDNGIVHRDIKSQNVMLTESGEPKVLDFGLAQTSASTKLTRQDSTLGTVAYMSPEQTRGDEVDRRTDFWSLGVTLYEMIAGTLPFGGEYEQAVVYSILNEAPQPLTAIRMGVPVQLEWIVDKLLAKEAEHRYQTAADLLADLKALDSRGSGHVRRSTPAMSAASNPTATASSSRRSVWSYVGTAAVFAVGVLLGSYVIRPEPVPPPVMRTQLKLPNATGDGVFPIRGLVGAITPDDKTLYYLARNPESGERQIATYDFSTGTRELIPGTEDAAKPIVSPDGRWVAFTKVQSGSWFKIPVSGGEPFEVTEVESTGALSFYSAFGVSNGIYYTVSGLGKIKRLEEDGSTTLIAETDSRSMEPAIGGVAVAPDGQFRIWSDWIEGTPQTAWLQSGDGAEPKSLMPDAWVQDITHSGHAIFSNASDIALRRAVPLNMKTGERAGNPIALGRWSQPIISPSGTLIYEDLSNRNVWFSPSTLFRVSPAGEVKKVETLSALRSQEMAVSSDASHLLLNARSAGDEFHYDMFMFDLELGTKARLTQGGQYDVPAWGADDEYVYFDYRQPDSSDWDIIRRRSDGSGTNEHVFPDSVSAGDPDLTPDGSLLVYREMTNQDIWGYDVEADSAFSIVEDDGRQAKPAVSPGGRYVVYLEGGTPHCGSVQVTAVSDSREPVELAASGCYPVWSSDGSAIYWEDGGDIYRLPVATTPVFRQLGAPSIVYSGPRGRIPGSFEGIYFDVSEDGTLYVAHSTYEEPREREFWVVTNWFQELNRLAPPDE